MKLASFGSNSAVITGQDVRDGLDASKLSLTPGGKYRVYAVYARSTPSHAYARNVVIREADNGLVCVQLIGNVAALAHHRKANTGYILDNSNEITAPVTITDNNPESATGLAERTLSLQSSVLNYSAFKLTPVG
ncbi:hypothetical protein PRIPAC_76113 [Pristionchus pacificus]|uniref:Uncharacterized protein n=1 Tax=Pristionchus pacificus TaxID=54126 RepID=A0A2A6C921_PRIPA|nr:hypothetical protein PRIPAC_76113 [Pristionchus pacificus]|eukprot:PDM74590.1 hypothetical protein PRIPAC_41946 [Pristionchus pacificus]